MEEILQRVQHDSRVFRHSEFISESNKEEILQRVQHDRWVKIVGCMECTNKKDI